MRVNRTLAAAAVVALLAGAGIGLNHLRTSTGPQNSSQKAAGGNISTIGYGNSPVSPPASEPAAGGSLGWADQYTTGGSKPDRTSGRPAPRIVKRPATPAPHAEAGGGETHHTSQKAGTTTATHHAAPPPPARTPVKPKPAPTTPARPKPAPVNDGPGWTLLQSNLLGEDPNGFHVWVDPHATAASTLAADSKEIAAELAGLGLPVTYAGYGTPKLAGGIILVTANRDGCGGGDTATGGGSAGWARVYTANLPNGDVFTYYTLITLCPRYTADYQGSNPLAVLRHEFGHAMGLGHTDYRFDGTLQVMNPVEHADVTDYQAGDRAGLAWLAKHTAEVKQLLAAA